MEFGSPTFNIINLRLRVGRLTLPKFDKRFSRSEGSGNILYSPSLKLLACPRLQPIHEVEKEILLTHVGNLEH